MRLLIWLIWSCVWAYVCGTTMEKKRKDSSAWYVLGFLMGVIAYIITLFIKPEAPKIDDIEISRIIAEEKVQALKRDITTGRTWVCPGCRKINNSKVYECSCGEQKPPRVIQQAVTRPVVETWTCNNCGMENSGHVFICNCGMKKSENEMKNKSNN